MGVPTIFALASAPGRAGVAVIRLSGPQCAKILQSLTRRALPTPRQAVLRALYRPDDGVVLDQAIILWLPAPHSFTGEDMLELHGHGGRAVLQRVTAALAAFPQTRLAEPGEFSRRGFENGKFDLTTAEAIADLVQAETEAQADQALRQMGGALSELYDTWAKQLTACLAHLEASIDFSDEELPTDLAQLQFTALQDLAEAISAHLADGRRGERLRDGYQIAILGAPNAGKSSLLNWLAQRDAAIVSAIAGTTRDIVEVQFDLGGYPVVLADTAGLREATDLIEQEGIRRAKARAQQADLKLLVFDAAALPELDPFTLDQANDSSLIIINKTDLLTKPADDCAWEKTLGGPHKPIFVSLRTGDGMAAFLTALQDHVAGALQDRGQPSLTRVRHRTALEECLSSLRQAVCGLTEQQEMALVAEDVRQSMRALGRITGRVDVEDLLDVIFRDFCIGK
ncbi:MAG: tRNA uridine-5-carboxymethylaminomethyl(34) synthesis GTPase MnmE [Alphaproteobacteria bacterium]|nr:tRNA uridine-5-carboxymethylaminomethyl(34) synthesis GTPase MnmE [Alphaproteobacteria bacterium]